jgi:hypothetical protein
MKNNIFKIMATVASVCVAGVMVAFACSKTSLANDVASIVDNKTIQSNTDEYAVFSAVAVNRKGIAVAGGQILEFGQEVDAGPSNGLVVGGLFFRNIGLRNTEITSGEKANELPNTLA